MHFSPVKRSIFAILLLGLIALACNGGAATPPPPTPPSPTSTSVPPTTPDNLDWAPDPSAPVTAAVPSAQAQSTARIDVLLIADSDYGNGAWQQTFFDDAKNLIDKAFPAGSQYQSLRQQFRFYVERNVQGDAAAGCVLQLDKNNPTRTLSSFGAFYDVAFIIHNAVFGDCSTANSAPISSSEKDHYLTFLHELGHSALGMADEYNNNGGYWVIASGPPNLYQNRGQCEKAESGTPVWTATPPNTPHPPYTPSGACSQVTSATALASFYRTDPAPSDKNGLLMRRAGRATPPAYGNIIARAANERVEWGKLRCAAGYCSDVAFHNCPTAGNCAVTNGHEPILEDDKESIDPKAPGAVHRRAVVLTLSVDADGNIQLLDQRLADEYARTHELAAFPYWQVEVISADESIQHQFSIWDPRLLLEEDDENEPLTGRFHVRAPVIFDLVFDLRDFANATAVRFTYPAIADPLPPGPNAALTTAVIPIDLVTPTTLMVGWPARFQTLDPVIGPLFLDSNGPLAPFVFGPEGLIASDQMLEPLVRLAGSPINGATLTVVPQLEVAPGLAESWQVSDDATVWTVRLRPNIRFHDGEPLTASAVVFNVDRWQATPELWKVALDGNNATAKVVDDLTVEFVLDQADASFINRLGIPHFGIQSPTAITKAGADYGGSGVGVVGTGPFRFAWNSGNRLLLQRNPDYWGEPPGVDEIMFQYIPDTKERWLAFRQQTLDMAAGMTSDVFADNPEQTPFTVLSDLYRYKLASLLVARPQPFLTGWTPDPFGAESYATITLRR
ncbi:MAG: hypothetical protein K1X65_24040 [Caldilineales bacterium]|nr:hypothetical protein [Caldilineales bacterium]